MPLKPDRDNTPCGLVARDIRRLASLRTRRRVLDDRCHGDPLMHHRSRLRQLIGSITVAALFTSTWAPFAAAQGSSAAPGSRSADPKNQEAPTAAPGSAAPAPGSAAPGSAAPSSAPTDAPPAGDSPAAPPLTEEERREKARSSFEAGQVAFAEQNYTLAHEQFQAAYELVPSPHTEYWMAASLDLQGGRDAEAARAYHKFLSHPGAGHVGEDKVAEARERLNELKAKLPARVTVTTEPAGAQVALDGVVQPGTTPLTLELLPGTHRMEATLPGHRPAAAELQVQGGDELEQRMTLEVEPEPAPVTETPAAPVATTPEPAERSMVPAYITLGLAGAGLVTGTLFGIKALADKGDYNDAPTAARADSVERNALIADMAFGIAITLGITGIVLLTSQEPEAESAKAKKKPGEGTFAFAPVIAPQLGGAAARLTF